MPRLKYYNAKTEAWEPADSVFGTGNVKTVNGVVPDVNGNIEVTIPEMPEISYPVTSVNGMTGDVVIEIPKVEIPEIHEQVQVDLSQNDPTQPDYVKHRTHYEENNQTVIEWDGNTEGRDCVSPTDGLTLCKVSDTLIEPEELVGRTIHLSDGRTYEITSDHIIIEDDLYCIIDFDTNSVYLYAIQALEASGVVFPSTGMYALYSDGMPHFSKVEYGNHVIHQLDEKFIPDSIARKDDVNVFLITLTMGDNVEDDTGAHDYSCRADRTYDEVNAAFVAGKHIVLRYDSNVYNFSNYTNYENFTLAFVENGEFHFTYVAYGESPYQCIKSGEVVLDSQGNWTYTLIHKQILPTSDAEDEPQMLLGDKYGWFTNPLFCHEVPSVTEENNGAFLQVVNGVWTAVNLTDVSTEGA